MSYHGIAKLGIWKLGQRCRLYYGHDFVSWVAAWTPRPQRRRLSSQMPSSSIEGRIPTVISLPLLACVIGNAGENTSRRSRPAELHVVP